MTFIRAEAGIGERQIQALGAEGEPDLAQLAGPDKAPIAGAAATATPLKPETAHLGAIVGDIPL
jgi:hypothetical protein